MNDDSPCNGICRMEQMQDEVRCVSCYRTYEDLNQWMYMTQDARIQRVKQLKAEKKKLKLKVT